VPFLAQAVTNFNKEFRMTSRFSYYRPRGVPGCYIIEVVLDLADTETGEVWVARNREHNCGQCGKQQPTSVQEHAVNGTRQLAQYIIGNFIAGDTITVKIHDEACEPIFQETSHVATMQGFVHELIPFYLNDQVWNKVCLNPIDLIDKDCGEEAFDSVPRASGVPQSLRRVVPKGQQFLLEGPNKKYSLPGEAARVQLDGNMEVYFSAKDNSLWVVPVALKKGR